MDGRIESWSTFWIGDAEIHLQFANVRVHFDV